jgi:hypothetical protein
VLLEVSPEGAAVASRRGAAVGFSDGHQQGVVFVVEHGVGGKVVREERLDLGVGGPGGSELVPRQDARRIRVDYEVRNIASVQEDGIGGFRTDAGHLEERVPEAARVVPEEAPEAPPVSRPKEREEVSETPRLDREGPGGPDEGRQAAVGEGRHGRGGERPGFAKAADGPLDVPPAGVLGEDCADDDFESGPPGPPALRTEPAIEPAVYVEESSAHRMAPVPLRRSGARTRVASRVLLL